MEIRRTPLPGHVQYMLDGAVDCCEIDGCTSATLMLYGDPTRLDQIGGPPLTAQMLTARAEAWARGERPEKSESQIRNERLMAEADQILVQLDDRRRGALIFDGIRSVNYAVTSSAEVLAGWALIDATTGGDLEAWKPRNQVRIDRHGRPFRRTWQRVCSPSFIRKYTKRTATPDNMVTSIPMALNRIGMAPDEYVRNDPEIWHDMDMQLEAFRNHRIAERAMEDDEFYRRALDMKDVRATLTAKEIKQIDHKHREKVKKRRKLLKRASAIASSVLGVQAVNALARGENIKIDGPSLSLQLSKSGYLSDFGHGKLNVEMLDHDGERLAKLCIYQDNVPAIDQAVGFALMMQSGMEKELLDEANITSMYDGGMKNELIAERQKKHMEGNAIGDRIARAANFQGPRWDYDKEQTWRREHWSKTKHLWIAATEVVFLGRRLKMIKEIAGRDRWAA